MDGKIKLDAKKLKSLRRQVGVSQEGLITLLHEHNIYLSISSLKRAELGKYVHYRTARLISDFYQKDLAKLEVISCDDSSVSQSHCQHCGVLQQASEEGEMADLLRENAELRRMLIERDRRLQ